MAEISLVTYLLLAMAAYLTAAMSAATGMGGGFIFLISINHFLPLSTAIPIHGLIQLKNNALRVYALREHLITSMCLNFGGGAILGVIAVTLLLQRIQFKLIPLILIFLLVAYSLFKPKKMPYVTLPTWGYLPLGIVTGIIGILVGAVDPLLAPFFLRKDLSRHQVISNKSFFQLIIHISKIPVFIYLGFHYQDYLSLIVVLLIAGALGTFTGIKILDKISQKLFIKIFKGLLFLVWLKVAYNIWQAL